jgi:hypothetical protein
MKAYLVTTGSIFGLITFAHLRRIVAESSAIEPLFILLTIVAATLSAWAWFLLRRAPKG